MFDFSVRFQAIDKVSKVVDNINNKLDDMRSKADKASNSLKDRFRNLNLKAKVKLDLSSAEKQIKNLQNRMRNIGNGGKNMMGMGMGALTAGAGFAVAAMLPMDVARRYELAFKDVKKSVSGTDEQLDALYTSMKQFEGVSFEDLAVAYAEAGKMGFDASTVAGFADGVVKGATALDFSVEEAIGKVGKILAMTNQMETAVKSSQDIMDKVAAIENRLAGVKASGVIDIWQRNADIYNSLKFNNAEMAALSGFLEQNFVSSELGASGFKMMINQFQKLEPKLGFLKRIKTDGLEGLKSVIEDISKMDATEQLDTFGVGAMELINKLKGAENMKKLDFALEVSLKSTGAVDDEWSIFMATFDQKVNGAKKAWNNLMETLGKPMMKVGGGVLGKITPIIEKITEWAEKNKELTSTIMTIAMVVGAVLLVLAVLAIVVGGVSMAIGALAPLASILTGSFGLLALASWLLNSALLANPITWVVLGVIALIAVIALIIYYFEDWWGWIVNVFNEFLQIQWVQDMIRMLGNVVSTVFAAMQAPFNIFLALWGFLWGWVQKVWNQMVGFAGALGIVKGAIGMMGAAFSALAGPISAAIGWIDRFLSKFELYNRAKSAISSGWSALTGGGGTGKVGMGVVKGSVDVNVTASGGANALSTGRGGVNLRNTTNGIRR